MRRLSEAERAFVERMPKAELHVDLEGSLRPEMLLDLGRSHGCCSPFTDAAGARVWFHFRAFPPFFEFYVGICASLRTVEDSERVTFQIGADARRQNIHYLEV